MTRNQVLLACLSLIVAVGLLLFVVGVKWGEHTPTLEVHSTMVEGCTVESFGNGVYHFGCLNTGFARALSTFIGQRDQRETVSIVTPGNLGYYVIVERR